MNDYVHINKAVRKYNKTRQTFYNYIKKGYVKTKKVNNKIYLLISDIENLLNDFIPAQTIIEPNNNKAGVINSEGTETIYAKNKNIDGSYVHEIKNHLYSINEHTSSTIENLKQEISKQMHNKNIGLREAIENKIAHTNRISNETQSLISHTVAKQNKILFWMYYLVFVSINIFILRYIS